LFIFQVFVLGFKDFFDSFIADFNVRRSSDEEFCIKFSSLKNAPSSNGVESFVVPVTKTKKDFSVGGCDSGFVLKSFSFTDIAFIRTSGVIFNYAEDVLKSAEYFPSAFTLPEPILLKPRNERDNDMQGISLERLKKEISLAKKIIEEKKPQYFFIDGSLVPQQRDKPSSDSELSEDYGSVIKIFEKLYEIAQKNSTILIGCVEDSRGARFLQILHKAKSLEVKKSASDSSFLDSFLEKGKRTSFFPYASNPLEHAVLKDYNEKWRNSINVFYIKSVEHDKPLRVEFISPNHAAAPPKDFVDKVASIVYALSSIHPEYCFPTVLIESDIRAKLNEKDIGAVCDKILDTIGPKFKLRRNMRPF
jgi:hypothetical protein